MPLRKHNKIRFHFVKIVCFLTGTNYDVENKGFEIYLENETKVLHDMHVDSFDVINPKQKVTKYVKLANLTNRPKSESLNGFGRLVVQKNNVYLVDRSYIYIKEPNYNLATNT